MTTDIPFTCPTHNHPEDSMGHPSTATGRSLYRTPSNWSFMSKRPAAPAPLPEPVSVTEQGVGVPRRQEVEFADGSRITLCRVDQAGVPDLYLRELGAPAAGVVVDLRRLLPDAAGELPLTSTRDVAGWVHFALRGAFKTCDAFVQAARTAGPAPL